MAKPVVIAHRGASGYRPENTLESFALGIQQGADGLEFDLVATKDQHLIIRHENALGETTNVSYKDVFKNLKRDGVVEDQEVSDWFTEDFTLEQIKSLRAIERLPDLRPGSKVFDEQFAIPTFTELLEAEFIQNKILVVELKRGSHLNHLNKTIGEIAAQNIFDSKVLEKNVDLIIESFDYEILMDAKRAMQALGLKAKYFLALENTSVALLNFAKISLGLDGFAISLDMLFSSDSWVRATHGVGLELWAYTARAEESTTTIEAYYEDIIQTGVDGIFADQPDLLVRVLADRG